MIPEATLKSYDALVATHPGLERKGDKMPYTSINGHMSSFLTPDGVLALRLPAAELRAFQDVHGAAPVEQHGATLKEYVAVPAELLGRLDQLKPYFDVSCDYVGSLKPKKPIRSR